MRTENEIKVLPLEELQKLVIELRAVATGDKGYPNAKAIIAFITGLKKWKEPETIEVKNIAGHPVTADNVTIAKDASAKIYRWQYLALARFLEVEEAVADELKDAAADQQKKDAAADKAQAAQSTDLAKTITDAVVTGVAAGLAKAAKVAALIAFALCLCGSVQAQTQANLIGADGGYWVQTIAGLGNGVIALAIGTTNYLTPTTNSTVTTNVNWVVTNGQATNTPSYVTNNVVNQPGVVAISGFDQFTLSYSGQMMAGSTNVNSLATVDYSTDMVNWQTNKWQLPITMIATGQATTNLDVVFCNGGFLRLDSITMPAIVPETNTWFEIARKPSGHGP